MRNISEAKQKVNMKEQRVERTYSKVIFNGDVLRSKQK